MLRRDGVSADAWTMLIAYACLLGCAPAPAPKPPAAAVAAKHDHDHNHDHDDHEHPETVAAAIAELERLCADTKAHLAAGDHNKADGPVHMVGHLIEDLGGLVAKVKPEAEAEARKALDEIFDCFDTMDTAIHAAEEDVRKKLDYAEHAPRIEAAIARLKELLPESGPQAPRP